MRKATMSNSSSKAVKNTNTKEAPKAEVAFRVTEVQGRSKSAPIHRQGEFVLPLNT